MGRRASRVTWIFSFLSLFFPQEVMEFKTIINKSSKCHNISKTGLTSPFFYHHNMSGEKGYKVLLRMAREARTTPIWILGCCPVKCDPAWGWPQRQ